MPSTLKLTIELTEDKQTSPSYESYLRIPLPMTEHEMEQVVNRWFDLMMTGLRINAVEVTATLDKPNAEAL